MGPGGRRLRWPGWPHAERWPHPERRRDTRAGQPTNPRGHPWLHRRPGGRRHRRRPGAGPGDPLRDRGRRPADARRPVGHPVRRTPSPVGRREDPGRQGPGRVGRPAGHPARPRLLLAGQRLTAPRHRPAGGSPQAGRRRLVRRQPPGRGDRAHQVCAGAARGLGDLRADVDTIRRGLGGSAGRWERWRARLLPRSTRKVATALSEKFADALDAVDLGVAAVTRRLHLRRS